MLPDNHLAYRQPDESLTAWRERVLALVEQQEHKIAQTRSALEWAQVNLGKCTKPNPVSRALILIKP